jgi:hypothetical protein
MTLNINRVNDAGDLLPRPERIIFESYVLGALAQAVPAETLDRIITAGYRYAMTRVGGVPAQKEKYGKL